MRPLGEILDNAEARDWRRRRYRHRAENPEGDGEKPDEGMPEDVEDDED